MEQNHKGMEANVITKEWEKVERGKTELVRDENL